MYSIVQIAEPETFLNCIKLELQKKWPENRTFNIVFHAHPVPTGYTKKGVMDRFDSYQYPRAGRNREYSGVIW
jgi:protoheme ferro-lyase